jgi:hypothetical protein
MIANSVAYLKNNKKVLASFYLFAGTLFDFFWIERPDNLYVNSVLLIYLFISAVCILLLNSKKHIKKIGFINVTFVLQFTLGALAGSLIVLYSQSGTFAGSFIFFLIFASFLIGNEFLHHQYEKIYIHLTAWYFLLITYCNIVVPILLKSFGTKIFLLSMILSVLIVSGFLYILYYFSDRNVKEIFSFAIFGIILVSFLYGFLYIKQIIPPVPLSIKNIGMYHHIEKSVTGEYLAKYEKPKWYEVFRNTSLQFNKNGTEDLYCFSSVFAPDNLNVKIVHQWQYKKNDTDVWQDSNRIVFPISGGREDGYRAYTNKNNVSDGYYRCNVETETGALIGRTDAIVTTSTTTEVHLSDISLE